MKIEQYVQGLVPRLETRRVKEDLRSMRDELVNFTLPPYKDAKDVFADYKFHHEFTKDFDQYAKKFLPKYTQSYVKSIYKALTYIDSRFDTIEKMIDNKFSNDIVREGITYFKANLLQYIETIDFTIQYARRLLLATYTCETASREKKPLETAEHADIKWLENHTDAFLICIKINMQETEQIEKGLKAAPDVIVNPEQSQQIRAVSGVRTLDPLKMGFISASFNPIYHIRMAIARYQVNQYKLAKTEMKALELKLANLRNLHEGKHDAKLQEQVEYYQGRVDKLRYEIDEMKDTMT